MKDKSDCVMSTGVNQEVLSSSCITFGVYVI